MYTSKLSSPAAWRRRPSRTLRQRDSASGQQRHGVVAAPGRACSWRTRAAAAQLPFAEEAAATRRPVQPIHSFRSGRPAAAAPLQQAGRCSTARAGPTPPHERRLTRSRNGGPRVRIGAMARRDEGSCRLPAHYPLRADIRIRSAR
eukprot:scaffold3052_cov389-Prasinococcus_capsulatus_cf.AAC.5